jgi:hypothetical protein
VPLPPAIRSSLKTPSASGASLLGNVDLSSLEEKPMLTAARLERASQIASPDPLSVVPKALKPSFLATIVDGERVIPAEIVRLPAPHLQTSEQIPLLLRPGGRAQGPSAWSSAATRQLVDGWLARQPAVVNGSVRPVVLKLEPLPSSSTVPAGQPKTRPPRSKRPRSTARAPQRHKRVRAAKPSRPTPSAPRPASVSLEGPPAPAATPTSQGVQVPDANP